MHQVPAGRDPHPGRVRRRRSRTPISCSSARARASRRTSPGIPFVGRAGRLLTRLIEGIGLTRDDVYIANVVKCRPPGNRDPLPLEIETCRPYLEAQLDFLDPRVVVTLGNFATKLLLDTKDGITKLRGQEFPFGDDRAVLIPTLHPAAVLRNGGAALAQARADFVIVKRALARGIGGSRDDGTSTRHALRGRDRRARRARGRGRCVPGDVVVLAGELGAGKTVFAKGIATALGITEPVVSPTFTIVREYDGPIPLVHVDVYRLDHLQELLDLGLDDLVGDDAVTVVEWGDRVTALLPGRPARDLAGARCRRRRSRRHRRTRRRGLGRARGRVPRAGRSRSSTGRAPGRATRGRSGALTC